MSPRPEPHTPTTNASFTFPDCTSGPSSSNEALDEFDTSTLRVERLRNRRASTQPYNTRRQSIDVKMISEEDTPISPLLLHPRSQSDAFTFDFSKIRRKSGISAFNSSFNGDDTTMTRHNSVVSFKDPPKKKHSELSFMHDDSTILDDVRDSKKLVPEEPFLYMPQRKIASAVLHAPGQHTTLMRSASDFHPAQIFRIGLNPSMKDNNNGCVYPWMSIKREESEDEDDEEEIPRSRLFPSMRFLVAVLLCCCYITMSISTSNMAVALICMIKCPLHNYSGDLEWHSDQEGLVLAAQNAGSLLMLLTGLYADRINGKWMIMASLLLCGIGNLTLPLLAHNSFWYAVFARIAIGASDACMSPAINSLITRWFPHTERAAAIGIITGGRQIGTLFILPTAGYLCTRTDLDGGWPAIFYLSSLITAVVLVCWLPMGADKPAKQYCISQREKLFIESR